MDNKQDMYPVIEAVLFAAGYPVPYERLAELCEAEETLVRETVCELSDKYKAGEFGIQILLFDEACQMCTKETYESYVREALGLKQGGKLSNSSLEVLAIVAYHQPVTRSQIEKIRGVDSSYAVSSLTMKKLIEEKGRLEVPGRPVLFGTTADFLRCFGLSSLDDLPDASTFLDETQTTFDEEILNSGGEASAESEA
ncbi:MAG: SMC-Scp complex subunit ScpB [Clostridia bacterium]|nr:SMC-Scp complex subunit ScpB [Clostridia bacterium]